MSNWRPIVLSDLQAAAVSSKVTVIQNAASARSLPDPAPAAITTVTQELRAAIGFSGKFTVDANLTAVPNGLLAMAIKKIVREMTRSVGMPLHDDEKTEERTYEDRLDKIRKGEWPVDPADNPISTGQITGGPAAALLSANSRRFTRTTFSGL